MADSEIKSKKISELEAINNLLDDDLLLVSRTRNNNNVKATYDVFKHSISSDIDIANVKSGIESIKTIIGEDGETIHDIKSSIISNRTDIDVISAYTDQIALSVDGISAKVSAIIVESIPTATGDIVGGIKIGFEEDGNMFAVKLSTDGKAYVNIEQYTEIKSLIDTVEDHSLSLINANYNITELSNSLSDIAQEANIINELSTTQSDTTDFLYNLQRKLYDSQFRTLNTDISQSALVSVLTANNFDINDPNLSTVYCTYDSEAENWSISSNTGYKTTTNVSIDFSYERRTPYDDLAPVNGDVIAYSRNVEEITSETPISDFIWYRDSSQSQICTFNTNGEISCLSSEIEDLSTKLSNSINMICADLSSEIEDLSTKLSNSISTILEKPAIVYNLAFFGELTTSLSLNMLNVTDTAANSYIRIKLANMSDEIAQAIVNDKTFNIEPNAISIDDDFYTIDTTEKIVISKLESGLQVNVIVYENRYPTTNIQ